MNPSVFLGNGASYLVASDFYLKLNGINWSHTRKFSTQSSSSLNWQGEGWWSNEMMNIDVSGSEGASDVAWEADPHYTLNFTYSGGSWTCDDNYPFSLSFDSGNDEYTVQRIDGYAWTFHDSAHTNAGLLKRIEDPFDNDQAFSYSSGQLTDIVVDVVAGTDHKITYTYFTSGDNTGQLQYIKVYKSTTTTDANLIGQVEYVYHDSKGDDYGSEDDLTKVIVQRKGTSDGDGTTSIEELYHYRYYKGTYNASTNPGTDHQVRFVLLPENGDRLNDAFGDPLSQTNANFDDYANVIYEYDSNGRVRETQERLPGSSCGCGGAGGTPATTSYTWSTNGGSPDVDTWNIHGVADREDDSRVIFDYTRLYELLTWVVQDDKTSPTKELIWHADYGTSGDTEGRMTELYNPSACSAYDESSPYGVTLNSSSGVVHTAEYDTGSYAGYVKKIRIKQGSSGTADTLRQYARTVSERPDLPTTITEYESGSEADGRSNTLSYTFYDSGGDKVQLKQLDVTYPSVSAAKNGPAASAVEKYFYDKRTGALRWSLDGEGYVDFHAYEDETGVRDLDVQDANTSTLMTVIDDNWDGVTHGGLAADDTVPFSRTGGGTALDVDSSKTIDWLGRMRKSTDAEGMITYRVYKDDETRFYPAWDTSTEKTLLPIRITLTDKEGRAEDILTLDNAFDPNVTSNEPNGTTTYANSDLATRTVKTYDISGQLSTSERYHTIPASGDGTRYTNFYRTTSEYDDMGRLEYTIADVADETDEDREQVTMNVYDFLGRRIEVKEGVSDNDHDITVDKPTMISTAAFYFDDPDSDSTPEQGEGDGNVHWVRKYYGTGGGEYDDTEYQYDWRNRRQLIIPPIAPYTLIAHDNLDRVTATGTYSATTNLDPGDDPATTENGNRLDLFKTYYDEWGRVYKSEKYDDPGDATPADELASNTYYDRRRLVWAVDAPNTGISFTKYDGLGRRTEMHYGTDFDTAKYTGSAPDYLDDDEDIVQVTEYTLDEVGRIEKSITKELNHDDTDGMDLTADDDYIRSYVYNWYDDAHRLTDTANYGTNNSSGWKDNSTAPTYGASAPSRSDTVLVTTYTYDSEGRRSMVTDPKNIATLSVYDKLSRVTSKEEADGTADERITNYEYDGLNSLTQITADLTTDQETAYVYADSQNARWVTQIQYPNPSTGVASSASADTIDFTYNDDGTLATRTDQIGTVITWVYDELRRKIEEEVTTVGSGVDSTVRAITTEYDSEGLVTHITSHTDTTPDTASYTDAANQIEYTYDAADNVTKEEQEVNGATDGHTPSVQYSYDTDYVSDYYNRREYMTYPNNRKVWSYYEPDSSPTFQEEINGTFNRVGEIRRDDGGSMGDTLAQYLFNGMGRFVRREHDEDTGKYGNDTRHDLYHGTTGQYDGLDRFGRVVDLKHVDFSGSATDFIERKYTYDRNSNRESIEHVLHKADSQAFTYDNLDRVGNAERGILDSSEAVQLSDVKEGYDMDLLGNFNGTNGIALNQVNSAAKHTTNATNEISSIDFGNPSGGAEVILDPFTTSLADIWTQDLGTWSISSGQVNVDTLSSGDAKLLAGADLDFTNLEVKITFPFGSTTSKAGVLFGDDGTDDYAVVLDQNAAKIALYEVKSGSWGSALASASATILPNTQYTIRVFRRQREVIAVKVGESGASFAYQSSADISSGEVGLYSDKTSVKFDDFAAYRSTTRVSLTRGFIGLADASISSGTLLVNGSTRGGDAIVSNFTDDDYMVEVDADLNSGNDADIYMRYTDANNAYRIRLESGSPNNIYLHSLLVGKVSTVASSTFTGSSVAVKIKVNSTTIKAWIDGTLKINTTNSHHTAGGVALSGDQPKFDNLEIGYDTDADDDLDASDDIAVDEDFGGTSVTITHDDNGNLTDDGRLKYTYDAWNRLVKVTASNDTDVVIQAAEYDGKGRRMTKVVTNSGDLDTTMVYLYDGWKICEIQDGSDNMVQQFIHGTQYIDELVMVRVKDKGDLYVHQDANWNVVALTDLGTHLVERYVYTPYGELIVEQETSFGDRDGDGDVDATDKGTVGVTCTGTVTGSCRILDLDFDGDYDSGDATLFDSLPSGLARHPGRASTGLDQPFAHQGLLFDAELASYQNRHRQYDPAKRRFLQRDPWGLAPGNEDGANLYAYVQAQPTGALDPLGLCQCTHNQHCWLLGSTTYYDYDDKHIGCIPWIGDGGSCWSWEVYACRRCRYKCECDGVDSHHCAAECHKVWYQTRNICVPQSPPGPGPYPGTCFQGDCIPNGIGGWPPVNFPSCP
ncbi:MAG: RHS repeat-associated core domain-containing protein [Planctomycetota bacterium]